MAESWTRATAERRRTIVVVTASNEKQAAAVEQELAARRQSGCFGPDVLLFAVPDPSSARVGSGGATFNALITVQELVSASVDIENCLVICIHSGGDSQRMYTQSVRGAERCRRRGFAWRWASLPCEAWRWWPRGQGGGRWPGSGQAFLRRGPAAWRLVPLNFT